MAAPAHLRQRDLTVVVADDGPPPRQRRAVPHGLGVLRRLQE
ncbi:MAG TPA: hypothetical protein VFN50_08250 [Acidimicrobiales bacterium]|nr:hypothetical protein [Acidimicrobiales bacterium]